VSKSARPTRSRFSPSPRVIRNNDSFAVIRAEANEQGSPWWREQLANGKDQMTVLSSMSYHLSDVVALRLLDLFRAPDGTPFVTPILSPNPWYRISQYHIFQRHDALSMSTARDTRRASILLSFYLSSVLLSLFLSFSPSPSSSLALLCSARCPFTSPRCVITRRNRSHSEIWYSSFAMYGRAYRNWRNLRSMLHSILKYIEISDFIIFC